MTREIQWVVGNNYDATEMDEAMTLGKLAPVEHMNAKHYHVYQIVHGTSLNTGKYVVSFSNQPEVRHYIRDHADSVLGIGFFKVNSPFFTYPVVLLDGTTVHAKTVARVTEVVPGDKQFPRSIMHDPSGIIIK